MTLSPLERAIVFACEKHSGQVDLSGAPYIRHPLAVMLAGENEYQQIVGVLHDVIEDTDATWTDIADLFADDPAFGHDVAEGVRILSRPDGVTYTDFIASIETAAETFSHGTDIARVKINDLRHNLSRLTNLPKAKQKSLGNRYRAALLHLTPLR